MKKNCHQDRKNHKAKKEHQKTSPLKETLASHKYKGKRRNLFKAELRSLFEI